MSLVAEELVEEWLNRPGYFTIRGVKAGVHEIDVLAVRPRADGYKYNTRTLGDGARVPEAIQRSEGRRLTYAQQTGRA